MYRSAAYVRFFILILLLVLTIGIWWLPKGFSRESVLEVAFLNVGQGDAIYITTPDGHQLLIDGGATAAVLSELAKHRSFFDRSLDMVLATHYDTDHIGGLVDVLKRFKVDWIIESGSSSDTPAASAYKEAVLLEQAKVIKAQAGQNIKLGEHVVLRVLSPQGDTTNWDSNTASAVVQVIYGDIEFMLTGDAPSSIEDYLVQKYGSSLESEILKLGHHGSNTSTSELFLQAVKPDFAVVSAAKDNRYGHPHQAVVNRVLQNNINLLNTADGEPVVFISDGVRVWQ